MSTSDLFDKKKVKKTLARKAISDLLRKTKRPLDVSEIIEKLSKKDIKVDRATVFRNINLMVKKGFINRVEFNEGKFRYESSSLPHHHHLICTNCNAVEDVESNLLHKEIANLSKKSNKLYGFKTENHKMEFFGKCQKCKKID